MKNTRQRILSAIAAAAASVMALSFTGCATITLPEQKDSGTSKPDKSEKSDRTHTYDSLNQWILGSNNDENNYENISKDTGIWDILPEIPVTDASMFECEYNSRLEGMVVTYYYGNDKQVRIPDTLEGEPVVEVNLSSCEMKLTEIVMPDSVCDFILSDTIKSTLLYINIPGSMTEISSSPFYTRSYNYFTDSNWSVPGCKNLMGVYIANGVAKIGERTFHGTCLKNISIPNSVTHIGDCAFYNCDKLTNVYIGSGVTEIGDDAFYGCSNLTATYKGKTYDYEHLNDLYDKIYYGENGLVIDNGVLKQVSPTLTNVVIPDGVTEIGDSAFSNCEALTSVTIPDSVTKIGDHAFRYCASLTRITIPDSVTTIGCYAFCGCKSLTAITIPDSVTEIDDGVFSDCANLTSVAIPNSVTKLGIHALSGCTSLTNITIPDSVNEIGSSAFNSCTNLLSIIIPNNVTYISGYTFINCTSLTSIAIPDSVTLIDYEAFRDCISLTNVSIGGGVTEIGEQAFYGCTSLKSITIPGNVKEIDRRAFVDCKSLTSVNIGNGVIKIGEKAFQSCDNLTNITIADSVNEIGRDVFNGCSTSVIATYKGNTYNYEQMHYYDLYYAINGR